MGWTSYHATYYKRNGSIDRKAECDAYFLEGLNRGHYEVLKSAVVGSVYYAAVRNLKRYVGRDENGNYIYEDAVNEPVRAAVFLTQTDSKDYFNFYYKDMSEDMGPCECDCPVSILKLLSPTDSEWALKWRERCRKRAEQKKSPTALSNLPVGARIRFTYGGEVKELVKHPPAYQFKRPFWYNPACHQYMSAKHIPDNYEIVSMG